MIDRLSKREHEVVLLMLEGYAMTEVARRLCLSPKTVDSYKRSAMRKLGARNKVELVKIGIRQGLITL